MTFYEYGEIQDDGAKMAAQLTSQPTKKLVIL